MLKVISKIQKALVAAESYLLVICVLAMLLLAGYNVFYRNLLVPLQMRMRSMGVATTTASPSASGKGGSAPAEPSGTTGEATEPDTSAGSGGFGGGFGAGAGESTDAGDPQAPEAGRVDESSGGGFQGGFGAGAEADASSAEGSGASNDREGGFQGGFGAGGGQSADAGTEKERDESGGFGGGFGGSGGGDVGTAQAAATPDSEDDESASAAPGDEPPPAVEEQARPGPWARAIVVAIGAIKISWIDTFLRHMVLVVGFLGAMIAARRREHITIDALGRLLTGSAYHVASAVTNLFALGACIALAVSGWSLVEVSLQFPSEILPGIQKWFVQLMFPVGFAMIGIHFALHGLEDLVRVVRDEPREEARLDGEASGAEGEEGAA